MDGEIGPIEVDPTESEPYGLDDVLTLVHLTSKNGETHSHTVCINGNLYSITVSEAHPEVPRG